MSTPEYVQRLFRPDGRCLVLAMDHAITHGAIRGLDDPAHLIDTMIAGGADTIMTSYGVIKKYGDRMRGRVPVIVRVDGGPCVRTGTWREYTDWRPLYSVEDVVRLGASAVVVMHFVGAPVEMDTLQLMADAAVQAGRAGVPLLVEALPCPHPNIPDIFAPDAIALAARVAAEHGADIVKTTYSGDVASFQRIVQTATVPLLVLGGEQMNSDRAVLELVHGSIAAGAAGIAMGRNIWQAKNPVAMLRALRAIIHDDASVEQGMELLRS